ncbi:putative HTH-type transcriptional regulator YjiR isoform X2 [Oculina patagonica]
MELGSMHCLASQDPGDLFQHGPRQGNLELHQSLANFLNEEYGHQVSSDHLFITGGSSQGLVLLCNALFQSGDPVFVADPTGSFLDIFRDLGLKVVSVPTDENGLIVEELDKLLKVHSYRKRAATEKKPFWGLVYLMTIFNNPTGQSLPEDRCNALIDIFEKHKVLCVCDDTLACLSCAESNSPFKPAPKRLFGYDQCSTGTEEHGNIVSQGSFSTIFSPGLRIGWLEAPQNVLGHLKNSSFVRHVGSSQHYLSGVMASVIELGELAKHLSFLKITYHGRLNAMSDALVQHMPKEVKFSKPQGGICVWLTLPQKINANGFPHRLRTNSTTVFG